MRSPFIHEARLREPTNGEVRCLTCERRCLLDDGQAGWCRTRENRAGALYTLSYGAISSLSANPIEKKPLYHFYPGSRALTSGAWPCNFGCPLLHITPTHQRQRFVVYYECTSHHTTRAFGKSLLYRRNEK